LSDSGPCSAADRHAAALGIVRGSTACDSASAELVAAERHLNGDGVVHGGVLFSLADAAVALAANAVAGETALVTGAQIQFLETAHPGDHLVAVAQQEFRRGRRAGYRVRVERGNDLIAVGHGETLVRNRS
jgi:acyl-CoA thioesterase